MSRFRKVFVKMWGDSKFRSLSAPDANGQTLWFFLLTGPQTTRIPGLFSTGEAGFAEKIGWSLEGFRKAFSEIASKGMVKADWKAQLIWVPKAIHHNIPENPNVVKGWKDTWEEMPECDLKLKAYEEIEGFLKGLGETFLKAFQESCSKPLANPFGNPLPNPLGNRLPNQEQEQEPLPPSEGGTCRSSFQNNFNPPDVKLGELIQSGPDLNRARTHPRLEIFMGEYLLAKGQHYLVGNYREEGGAARRTQSKIPDDEHYRQAVRAYLANQEKRLAENGHPFLWFIRELNRWATLARGDTHVRKHPGKYDHLCE